MSAQEIMLPLRRLYEDFIELILSLPDELFLSPINGWAPRDVVAHLIGWNSLMIEASSSILAGQPPSYYADAPNDYSHINAGFTAQYSSRSKQELLEELKSSLDGLERYVLALPSEELVANHGVRHYRDGPATVSKIVESLAGDYRYHTDQIREWLNIR